MIDCCFVFDGAIEMHNSESEDQREKEIDLLLGDTRVCIIYYWRKSNSISISLSL